MSPRSQPSPHKYIGTRSGGVRFSAASAPVAGCGEPAAGSASKHAVFSASVIEKAESIPSASSMTKNSTEKKLDHGIIASAVGKTMKASPGPCDATSLMQRSSAPAMKPSTENTATPATIEKKELERQMMIASATTSWLRGLWLA